MTSIDDGFDKDGKVFLLLPRTAAGNPGSACADVAELCESIQSLARAGHVDGISVTLVDRRRGVHGMVAGSIARDERSYVRGALLGLLEMLDDEPLHYVDAIGVLTEALGLDKGPNKTALSVKQKG